MNPRPHLLSYALLPLCLVTALSASAATMTWTNTSGGTWSVAANWDPNQVPSWGDTVFITNNGSYTVVLDTDAPLASLQLGAASGTQTLTMTNYVLMLGDVPFEISGGGRLRMEGGYLGGSVAIANGGQVIFAGDATKYLPGTKLNNAGTVLWTNGGNLSAVFYRPGWILPDVLITNLPGGSFDIAADAQLTHLDEWAGSFVFHNAGTLRKSSGGGTTILGAYTSSPLLVFHNAGNIVVEQGALVFSNGFVSSGTFTLATNTTVRLDAGTFGFGPASLASGSGQLLITNGSVTLAGTIPSLTWNSGTIMGNFTVNTNATLTIGGDAPKYLYGTTLNNAGTIRWTGAGDLTARFWEPGLGLPNVLITNLAGATFEIANDAQLIHEPSGGAQSFVFHNAGTLRKSAGAGTNTFDSFLTFASTGVIDVQTGALNFSNAVTQVGGMFVFGASGPTAYGHINVAGPANLSPNP